MGTQTCTNPTCFSANNRTGAYMNTTYHLGENRSARGKGGPAGAGATLADTQHRRQATCVPPMSTPRTVRVTASHLASAAAGAAAPAPAPAAADAAVTTDTPTVPFADPSDCYADLLTDAAEEAELATSLEAARDTPTDDITAATFPLGPRTKARLEEVRRGWGWRSSGCRRRTSRGRGRRRRRGPSWVSAPTSAACAQRMFAHALRHPGRSGSDAPGP